MAKVFAEHAKSLKNALLEFADKGVEFDIQLLLQWYATLLCLVFLYPHSGEYCLVLSIVHSTLLQHFFYCSAIRTAPHSESQSGPLVSTALAFMVYLCLFVLNFTLSIVFDAFCLIAFGESRDSFGLALKGKKEEFQVCFDQVVLASTQRAME